VQQQHSLLDWGDTLVFEGAAEGAAEGAVTSQPSDVKVIWSLGLNSGIFFCTDTAGAVRALGSDCTENKVLLTAQALPLSEASLCRQQGFAASCANSSCVWPAALLGKLDTTVDSCPVSTQTMVNAGYPCLCL